VLDVAVAPATLSCRGPVSQRVAAGVPEHVGVWLEAELRLDPGSLNHPRKSGAGERRSTL